MREGVRNQRHNTLTTEMMLSLPQETDMQIKVAIVVQNSRLS